MKAYRINQKKKTKLIKSMKKTRLIYFVTVFLLGLPLADVEDSIDPTTSYLMYIIWGIFLIFFVPALVPKRLKNYRVELNGTTIRQNKPSKRPIKISKIRFIKETKHGLLIFSSWGWKVWVPSAINKYEEIKDVVNEKVDPIAYRWYRMPGLFLLIILIIFPPIVLLIIKRGNLSLEIVYSSIVAFLSIISFVLYFE
jgi:hypothetical protein